MLFNGGPGSIAQVSVIVHLPSGHASTWGIIAKTCANQFVPASTMGTIGIKVAGGRKTSIAYIPGSTWLAGPNEVRLGSLPDGITQGGIQVPRSNIPGGIGVGSRDARYVFFDVELMPDS